MVTTMHSQGPYRTLARHRGFTLVEILIALGILAIRMSMVAAIFPAAMVLNRQSTNSTLGTIICENGLVLAEMVLTAEEVGKPGNNNELQIYADDNPNHVAYLSRLRQSYPTDPKDPSTIRTGFVLMARKVPANTDKVKDAVDVFQLITVAYRKRKPTNTVELVETSCSVNGRDVTGAGGNLRIGSPLISLETGAFAFIDSINAKSNTTPSGVAGTLDIKLNQTLNMPKGSRSYYVLVEKDGGNTVDRRSPAIGVMSKMTGLNGNPAPAAAGQ